MPTRAVETKAPRLPDEGEHAPPHAIDAQNHTSRIPRRRHFIGSNQQRRNSRSFPLFFFFFFVSGLSIFCKIQRLFSPRTICRP